MLKYGRYSLYGNPPIIQDDTTLENFCRCLIKEAEAIIKAEDIRDEEDPAGQVEDVATELLTSDLISTDIDYEALMEAYAPEIGVLMYEADNRGMDLPRISFFGDEAKESFIFVSMFKIQLLLESGILNAGNAKTVKLHARVTREAEFTEEEAELIAKLARGSCTDEEEKKAEELLHRFEESGDSGGYEAGYIPADWLCADLNTVPQYIGDVDL